MLRLKVSFRKRSGSTEKHFLLLLPLVKESILVPRLHTYLLSSSPQVPMFQNGPEVQLVHPQLDIIKKKKTPQTPKSLMPHQLPASRSFLLQKRETIYSGKQGESCLPSDSSRSALSGGKVTVNIVTELKNKKQNPAILVAG